MSNGSQIYLPLVAKNYSPYSNQRTVNAPYFNVADVSAERFSEMAIFWFGRVTQTENYADVRAGYNNSDLYLFVTIFDRRLWYDTNPAPADLTNWDAVTLYLDLSGNSGGAPATSSYRFVGQLNWWEDPRTPWQTAYRGNGSGWSSFSGFFVTKAGWRGNAPNDDSDEDRGWAMTFRIPFASLGLAGRPADGTVWGMALAVHDRDAQSGAPNADKIWPEAMDGNTPSTWARLRFGLPAYTPPPSSGSTTATIRQGLNGAVVPDAAVGGTLGNLCPGDSNFIWNQWGNANFAGDTGLNIQNQSDLADWPCFSKYYVTFPLNSVPSGKVVKAATLTLYHWGNSGSLSDAERSFIQVHSVAEAWSEATLTWNNAPLAFENVSRAWVDPVSDCNWPCAPRTWDVSYAVARAYAAGQPLRLALYSSDSAYHSGKFFTSSDTEDWNENGRPTLQVTWGNPP
jgi:hypothetical protein